MAETKTSISELSAATAVAATDLLFVSQQSGSTWNSKKATVGQLSSAIGLGNYSLTSHTHSQYLPNNDDAVVSKNASSLYLNVQNSNNNGDAYIYASVASKEIGLYCDKTYSCVYNEAHEYLLPSADGTLALEGHAHGNITSGGGLQTTDVTIANGDKLVVTDADGSNKVARTSLAFDGSTTTQFLSKKGTWVAALTSHQSLTAYYTKADLTGTGGVLTGYSPTGHTHSQYLTAVPSDYKTYAATLSSLSSTYSLTSHTHSQYSLTSHNHSGVYAPASHAHGNVTSTGTLTAAGITITSGDSLVVVDSDQSSKIAKTAITFDGSSATQFLSKKGTWETPSLTGYVSKAELKTALASVGQIPGGDNANLENTIAKFNSLFAALSALTD